MKKTGRTHYKDQTGDKSSIFDISSEAQLKVGICTHTHTQNRDCYSGSLSTVDQKL